MDSHIIRLKFLELLFKLSDSELATLYEKIPGLIDPANSGKTNTTSSFLTTEYPKTGAGQYSAAQFFKDCSDLPPMSISPEMERQKEIEIEEDRFRRNFMFNDSI